MNKFKLGERVVLKQIIHDEYFCSGIKQGEVYTIFEVDGSHRPYRIGSPDSYGWATEEELAQTTDIDIPNKMIDGAKTR